MNLCSHRTHEAVVNALARAMRSRRYALYYSPTREDLVAISSERVVLFEVKTNVQAISIEQRLGQLVIYGLEVAAAYSPRSFHRVLVLPCQPSQEVRRAIRSVLVEIMTFRQLADDEFEFTDDPLAPLPFLS